MEYTKEQLESLYICSVVDKRKTKPSEHCKKHCNCGLFHQNTGNCEGGFCNLHESGTAIKTVCRRIKKKEVNFLLDDNINISKWVL